MVLPNLITQHFLNGYNQPSFVVYSLGGRNESQIVQVTTIIGFNGKIDGLLGNQWLAKSTLPANITKQSRPNLKVKGIDGYVISISRLNWEEARNSILENNPAAILIIDTERLMQSSPQPQFYENSKNVTIPTFLVRKEDGHHFLPELELQGVLTSLGYTKKCLRAKRATFTKKFVFCYKKLLFQPFLRSAKNDNGFVSNFSPISNNLLNELLHKIIGEKVD